MPSGCLGEKGRGQGSLPTAYRDCGGMGAYWRTGPPQPVLREPGRWRPGRQGPVRAGGCLRLRVSARRFKGKGPSRPMEWISRDPGRVTLFCALGGRDPFKRWWGEPRRRFQVARKLTIPPDAGVAKLADAQDLKSWDPEGSCGFDSRPRHSRSFVRVHAGCACRLIPAGAATRLGLQGRFPAPGTKNQ